MAGEVGRVVGAGVVSPGPGSCGPVVADGEVSDLVDEVGAGGELAAAQQGAGQHGEPQFGHVHPGGVLGRVSDADPGVRGEPGAGRPGGVRRPVVHDQVNVQSRVGALVQAVQEAGEGDRVVTGDRLGDDLPGGDVQRGDDGDGAVADVLELPPGQPARPWRLAGMLAV